MPSTRIFPYLIAISIATHSLGAQEAVSVRTVQPEKVQATLDYTFPGRTEPNASARIFTRATGIVDERKVDIGDRVKEGDVLAVIHAPDLDRAIEAAQASVDQMVVRTANAKTQAERAASLAQRNAISIEEADQKMADSASAEAAERLARAELARLEEQRNFTIVTAPFHATVAARNFDQGDRVRGDSATSEGWLYHLVQLSILRFAVQVAPELALRLDDESDVTIRFNELPGREFNTRVARTSKIFDPQTGTMRVETEIDNTDLSLPAGLSGIAIFSVKSPEGVYLVPNNAVVLQSGRATLATVQEGKVVFIPITTGKSHGKKVEVTSPELNDASQVIVNPNALLQAGDSVAINNTEE